MVEHPFVGLGMTPLGLLQRAAQTRLLPDGRPNLHRQRRHLLILGLLPLLQFDRLVLQPAALPLHRRGLLGGQAGAGGQAVQVPRALLGGGPPGPPAGRRPLHLGNLGAQPPRLLLGPRRPLQDGQ